MCSLKRKRKSTSDNQKPRLRHGHGQPLSVKLPRAGCHFLFPRGAVNKSISNTYRNVFVHPKLKMGKRKSSHSNRIDFDIKRGRKNSSMMTSPEDTLVEGLRKHLGLTRKSLPLKQMTREQQGRVGRLLR